MSDKPEETKPEVCAKAPMAGKDMMVSRPDA
jgi:hypothetical protein